MEKIHIILNELSDYELAVFAKYKLNSYMSITRKKIIEYMKNDRGLDPDTGRIEELISDKPQINNDDRIYCPACNSEKILKTRVKWIIPAFHVGYEDEYASWKELTKGEATYKDKIECFVCGHVLFDPNNEKRPFYKRIMDIFFDQPLPI